MFSRLYQVAPNIMSPTAQHTGKTKAVFRLGPILSLLYLAFAAVVAVTTYTLNNIANTPVYMGFVQEGFITNQYHVPVNVLLEGSGNTSAVVSPQLTPTLSLSTLLYKACGQRNDTCANAFLDTTNAIWAAVAKAFRVIPAFDAPVFQDPTQMIRFSHINNLSGWNKAVVQFHIDGHPTAVTCMVRRASFAAASGQEKPTVDSVAFCSQRAYDPKWRCENEVALAVNTYAIQVNKGVAKYIGMCPRGEVYFNPDHIAMLTGGATGSMALKTVPSINEYERGVIQAGAMWDVLVATECSGLDAQTYHGWLMQCEGHVTMTWQSDALMLSNAAVLLCVIVYLVTLQLVFLRHSSVCTVPVYMSKNVVGAVVLFVAFYGNKNLQALSTYLLQNPTYQATWYALCGPAQVASIVGIMTGTAVQLWFNPRLVTQTWLLMGASIINWILVFALEAFVFPFQSKNVPGPCALATTSNCVVFSAIPRNYYVSAVVAGGVVALSIVIVYVHSWWTPRCKLALEDNSVLRYFNITSLHAIATAPQSCVRCDLTGRAVVDDGLLLIKNMLHATPQALTRMN
ncbi:hypothetical protein ACHHYP_11680, partial [Achlya hypogyna]